MPRFGSHLSIAKGLPAAADAAARLGLDCLQVFTKSVGRWESPPLAAGVPAAFRAALERTGVACPMAHASYLINVAAPDDTLRLRSVAALVDELRRAEALGIGCVVVHPGAALGSPEPLAVERVAESVLAALVATEGLAVAVALENTAGQGSCLGADFGHLAAAFRLTGGHPRLGFCFDTCHALAAGYPLATAADYGETMGRFLEGIPAERILGFHLNDSKKPRGSRVDRHEHIGLGHVGLEAFAALLSDPRFADRPMVLETAKESHPDTGEPWDAVNLRTLRGLLAAGQPAVRGDDGVR